MADKKKPKDEDEYHFDDLDAFNLEAIDPAREKGETETEASVSSRQMDDDGSIHEETYDKSYTPDEGETETITTTHTAYTERSVVKRNALIVLAGVLLIFIIYRLASGFFGETIPHTKVQPIKPVQHVVPSSQVVTPPSPPIVSTPIKDVQQELARVQQAQASVSSQIVTINDQMQGVNNNIQLMSSKITELSQAVEQLNARLEEQSVIITHLKERPRPKPHVKKVVIEKVVPKLFLQAVIPGRAWLVEPISGTTLTVREGTLVNGYGKVKLIDPIQGRVLTSSGKIIRFSQEDS